MSARPGVKNLVAASSVQVTLMVGTGGLALAVANLLYAGALSPADFGRLSLFQSLVTVGSVLAPIGYDSMIARKEVAPNQSIGRLTFLLALPAAAAVAILSLLIYHLPPMLLLLLVGGIISGAVTRFASSFDRAMIRLKRAQLVLQLPFVGFLVGALVLLGTRGHDWVAAAGVLAAAYAAAAIVGLGRLRTSRRELDRAWSENASAGLKELWPKASAFFGIAAAGIMLVHFERLLIPKVLSLTDLATFGVAATLVGSPYRLLQGGFSYALLPRLRAARNALEARRLIVGELRLAAVLGGGGGVLLALTGGPLIHFLYNGKYEASLPLVGAIVLSGCAKILTGILAAAIGALGDGTLLHRYNTISWVGNLLAFGVAVWASRFGVVGVVLGTSTGWWFRVVAGSFFLRRRLGE